MFSLQVIIIISRDTHIQIKYIFIIYFFFFLKKGGSVLSCLLPIPEEYNTSPRKIREYYHEKAYGSSDIDLFIYGLDEKAAMKKMLEVYDVVSNSVPWEATCVRNKNCVTIVSQYPYRHIQV